MGWGIIGDAVDAVGDAVEDGAEWIAGAAEDAAGAVADAAGDVGDAVEDAVDAVGDAVEAAAQAMAEAAADAVDALESAAEDALDALEQGAAAVADMADDAWDHLTDAAEGAWDALAAAVEDAWHVLTDTVEASWDALVTAVEDAWEAVEGAVSDAWDGAVRAAEAAWDRAGEIVEAGIDELSQAYEWAVETMASAIEWLGGVFVEIGQLFLQLGACIAGQVVYRVAKAGNIIGNIYKRPKVLSSDFRSDMVRVFGGNALSTAVNTSDFALVVYVDDALLSANWFSDGTDAMTFGMTSIAGVTVGGLIYADKPWDETVSEDRLLMAHELVHTTQYRRFINESGFACAYGVGYAKAGFDYASNPMEAQAYAFTDANEAAIIA